MMYFSKEELELIRQMLDQLFLDGDVDNKVAIDMYNKVTHQMGTME